MFKKDNKTELYIVELTKKPVLNFEFSDDAFFRVDFEEKIDFIPVEVSFVYKDSKGQRSINAYLIKTEYLPKNRNRSFGRYKCTYQEI